MPHTPTCILSARAVPGIGGQGLNLAQIIDAFRDSHETSVFCAGGDAPAGVNLHRVPESKLSTAIHRIPYVRRLRDYTLLVSERHYDEYVSRMLVRADVFHGATGNCLKSLMAARRQNTKTLLDVVTTHVDDYQFHSTRECRHFGIRPVHHPAMVSRIKKEYEAADCIRVMSKYAKQTFVDRGFAEEKVFVANPPFDYHRFSQAHFRRDRFRAIYVGLLEPAKGFHYLIDAFEQLKAQDAELVLWGSPGARRVSEYMNAVLARSAHIRMQPGSVREMGYAKVYTEASVLVHPSLSDGFAYVVGEAMASGLPVIVTSATGASQIVEDGVNGYIVPPGDSNAIAERLRHLMAHPALLRSMGEAARLTAQQLTIDRLRADYGKALAHSDTPVFCAS